jgi:hypothetical protein
MSAAWQIGVTTHTHEFETVVLRGCLELLEAPKTQSIINVSNTYLRTLLPRSLSLLAEYGECECFCSEGPKARGMCVCLFLFDILQTLCLLILLFSLAGVLGQCASLAHLLSCNSIGQRGQRVLAQCPALTHLFLSCNDIGDGGAESLAGVLAQWPALDYLALQDNDIGAVGEGRLRASWRGQASGLTL